MNGFRRAYGVSPRQWRSRPGTLRIEAANGIHFHPPSSIRLPAQRKVSVLDLMQPMVEHHVWLTGELIECAPRLTDVQLDQQIAVNVDDDPGPATLRRIISRLVGQLAMWNAPMASEAYDFAVEEADSLTRLGAGAASATC